MATVSTSAAAEQAYAAEFRLPGDEPEPPDGPGWLREQSAYYRSLGTEWAAWTARQLDALASDVRFTRANTPAEHDDRMEVLDRDAAATAGKLAVANARLDDILRDMDRIGRAR